jgi:hypothetical protein
MSTPTLSAKSEERYNSDEIEAGEPNDMSQETLVSDQGNTGTVNQETVFWNEPELGLPDCTNDFKFTHRLANPEDVQQIFFGPGSHIAPHEHMVYWATDNIGSPSELNNPDATSTLKTENVAENPSHETQVSEKIQLYAPTDIYRIEARRETRSIDEGPTYVEWGASLTICNGHLLMLGHVAEPSDEIWAALEGTEPECDVPTSAAGQIGCVWLAEIFIPAGTPIFKSSGFASGFDFGLMLVGLTVEELQEQPSYGYSITPWRVASGNAVCPLEYFPEPLRARYLTRLSDSVTGELFECGPFNQDVPGTAMGLWFPSPSPNEVPSELRLRWVDEKETIWLFQSNEAPSIHTIVVGNNTFGLDNAQYSYSIVSDGRVNKRWDSVKPGNLYCTELRESYSENGESSSRALLLLELSENGSALTIEAFADGECGSGPWKFQGGERTFYR